VAVVVGADRWAAGRAALERLTPPPEVFVLDDGFSHLGLVRDADVLAFPAADPFAGGRLLPGGRLREPLAAAARADAAVLTGVDEAAAPGAGAALAAALAPFGFRGPGFASITRPGAARLAPDHPLRPGSRVLLVAGIARPDRFLAAARGLGFEVAGELVFADHHDYPERSLAAIRRAAAAAGAAAVLTTGKDRVKLHGRLALPLAELPVAADPEPAFWTWLEGRLAAAAERLREARP
jgi:tetraacyldisaccharide 4'-kinase